MEYTVKAAADFAGITVRTLHHYDEIGLLKPSRLSPSGYRLYTMDDLERLQQIMFFRELGLDLRAIKDILSGPDFDRRSALLRHKELLVAKEERIRRLIRSIDRTLDSIERGIPMGEKDLFAGFDQTKYEEEARQRWGGSKEYEESVRKVSEYTKEDWVAIQTETGQVLRGLAALMEEDPADPGVQDLVRRHHKIINDWFYTCSTCIYRSLADTYAEDERFAQNYERVRPGLAEFMRRAMHVYCDNLEGTAGSETR